jgi:hypothetical protein
MADMVDDFRALKEERRFLRGTFGARCPRCKEVRPRAHQSILLPGQKCRVDGYVDPRPRLTDQQKMDARNG